MGRRKKNNGKGGNPQASKSARGTNGKFKKPEYATFDDAVAAKKLSDEAKNESNEPDEKKKDEKKDEKNDLPVFKRKPGKDDELRFSPYAWAKLIRLRDLGETEISVFGLSRLNDLLYVEDVRLVPQTASSITFEFDDEELNKYLFDMVQEGYQPVECMRIWIHTHPGGASPSGTDHETFDKVAGEADWGIMCIVGKDDAVSARLRITGVGRKYDVTLKVRVEWTGEFAGVSKEDAEKWDAEYKECVKHETYTMGYKSSSTKYTSSKEREQYYRDAYYYGDDYYGYGYGGYYEGDMRDRWNSQAWKDDGDKDMPRTPTELPKTSGELVKPKRPNIQIVHIMESDMEECITTIWTDKYWFEYDINETLLVEPGEEVEVFADMCVNDPISMGEALWSMDEAGNPTYERMSIWDDAENNGKGGFSYLETSADRKAAIDVRTTGLSAAEPEEESPAEQKEEDKKEEDKKEEDTVVESPKGP